MSRYKRCRPVPPDEGCWKPCACTPPHMMQICCWRGPPAVSTKRKIRRRNETMHLCYATGNVDIPYGCIPSHASAAAVEATSCTVWRSFGRKSRNGRKWAVAAKWFMCKIISKGTKRASKKQRRRRGWGSRTVCAPSQKRTRAAFRHPGGANGIPVSAGGRPQSGERECCQSGKGLRGWLPPPV